MDELGWRGVHDHALHAAAELSRQVRFEQEGLILEPPAGVRGVEQAQVDVAVRSLEPASEAAEQVDRDDAARASRDEALICALNLGDVRHAGAAHLWSLVREQRRVQVGWPHLQHAFEPLRTGSSNLSGVRKQTATARRAAAVVFMRS